MTVTVSMTEYVFNKASGNSYKHESFTKMAVAQSRSEFVFGKDLGLYKKFNWECEIELGLLSVNFY